MKTVVLVLYHLVVVGLSATIAWSLPLIASYVDAEFFTYRSLLGNERLLLVLVEMGLTVLLIFIFHSLGKVWRNRRLSNMARAAGLVSVTPAKGFLARRRVRKLKEEQGFARDVMLIGSTGYRTFVDERGELHAVIQNCREAKIMLLHPHSEGAKIRAKSILDPNVTPERFAEQIRTSIDFLKGLKATQKNIKLKLYPEVPLMKLTILGDYIWLQHYHSGRDVQMMPTFVFKHDQTLGSLYTPLYQYFLTQWKNPDIPEFDLENDELIYRDVTGNEIRREKFVQFEVARTLIGSPSHALTRGQYTLEGVSFSQSKAHRSDGYSGPSKGTPHGLDDGFHLINSNRQNKQ